MATPSENFVALSKVMTPMRLSEFVRTPWPTRSESSGRDDFRSFARSFTVPSTPPLNTTPPQVADLFLPVHAVDDLQVTRYPSDPSNFPRGATSTASDSGRIFAPMPSARGR